MRTRFSLRQMLGLLCMCAAFGVSGPAHAQNDARCPPTDLATLQKSLNDAQEQIQLVDYAAALATLDQAEQRLPCVNEIVPAATLVRLHLNRGLSYFYLGNSEGARLAFARALAADPGLRWDNRYGQRPREVFLNALEQSLARQSQNVRTPLLASGVQVYVNGKELSQGDTTQLKPGNHFLQIRWPDGRWEGVFFEVAPGRDLPLPLPRQALQGEKPTPRTEPSQPPVTRIEVPDRKDPPDTPEEPSEGGGRNVKFIASAGVAGGGAVASLVFGGLYIQSHQKLCGNAFGDCSDSPYYRDETNQDLVAERNALLRRNKIGAIGANTSLAVTALAAGAAVYFYLTGDDDEVALKPGRPLVLPSVGPHAIGLVLYHEF